MVPKPKSTNARLRARAQKNNALRAPPKAVLRKLYAKATKTWRVFGTYIGQKRSGGRWTKDIAVVCLAANKPTARSLPKRRRIPSAFRWKERQRSYRISTDVIRSDPTLALQSGAILGPGDRVQFNGEEASIGAAIDHPQFDRCITTAGHLFRGLGDIGATATAVSNGVSIRAQLKKRMKTGGIDYALLGPIDPCDCDNLFQDLLRVGPQFIPQAADVGRELFVLDGIADSARTICRGIHGRVAFGDIVLEDVILCDGVTRAGQSGTALVDSDNRIWGFLIGLFDSFSVFMPADTLLRQEQAQLVR